MMLTDGKLQLVSSGVYSELPDHPLACNAEGPILLVIICDLGQRYRELYVFKEVDGGRYDCNVILAMSQRLTR